MHPCELDLQSILETSCMSGSFKRPPIERGHGPVPTSRLEMLGEQRRLDQNDPLVTRMTSQPAHGLSKRVAIREIPEDTEERDDQIETPTE